MPGAVAIIAKTPEPGRTKTRLCPPLRAAQACAVAWACLHDTIDTVAATPAVRHVLVLDGEPGAWVPEGFDVIAQRGGGLAERLAAAFVDIAGPTVVIAMDTPQVSSTLLAHAACVAGSDPLAAVLGPACDGGYWLIGLGCDVDPKAVFSGVPMSVAETGEAQLARLRQLGLDPVLLPTLRDLDTVDDLWAIARNSPSSRLAALARTLGRC